MLFSGSRERQRLPEVFLSPEQSVYSPSNYISVSVLQLRFLCDLFVLTLFPLPQPHFKHRLLRSVCSGLVRRGLNNLCIHKGK